MRRDFQLTSTATTIEICRKWEHQVKILDFLKTSKSKVKGLYSHTGSGKTKNMVDHILANPTKRFLIVAHGRNFLKSQWHKSLTEAGIKHVSLSNPKSQEARVIVAICQEGKKVTMENCGEIDCLIFDEAHQFYLQKQARNILAAINPKEQILLTATPYILPKENIDAFYVAVEDGYERETIHQQLVSRLVLTDSIDFKDSDFNASGDLKRSASSIVAPHGIQAAMDEILRISHSMPFKLNEGHLKKTAIFCKDVASADAVTEYLRSVYGNLVVSSHSKNDVSSNVMESFVHDNKKLLVLVDRGLLGWDCPDLQYVVDMTGTMNFGVLMQMLGRLMRHGQGVKGFIKVMPESMSLYGEYALAGMLALCEEQHMREYNGNFRRLKVRVEGEKPKGGKGGNGGSSGGLLDGNPRPKIETDFMAYMQYLNGTKSDLTKRTRERCYVTLPEFLGRKVREDWTFEKALVVFEKYRGQNAKAVQKGDCAAYTIALRRGWLPELCKTAGVSRQKHQRSSLHRAPCNIEIATQWCEANQRTPSMIAENPRERRIGRWMNKNRNLPEIQELIQTWGRAARSSSLEDAVSWCKADKRTPSPESEDCQEKRVARWMNTNRKLPEVRELYEKYGRTARSSSKFLGVSWDKARQKWRAFLGVGGVQINLGLFISEIEAAQAVDDFWENQTEGKHAGKRPNGTKKGGGK